MEDVLLIDAAERYLNGQMTNEEKLFFEGLRESNPEVDQLVVEHSMFLQQISSYSANRDMRHQLNAVHSNLLDTGDIKETAAISGGTVVRLWNRYKRVTAIAATIASVTALVISGLVTYFTPASTKQDLLLLSKQVSKLEKNDAVQNKQIGIIIESKEPVSKIPAGFKPGMGGTSFLIDAKGYLATNAHVVNGQSTILVQSSKGQEFKANIVYQDNLRDIAILKIEDADFKPYASLPYSIRKSSTDLGAQIFTLGFPKDEIVYNEGYLSSKNGLNGDTVFCQIAVSANPGNSGGPVLNKNGEVIGILSTSQLQAEGVVFAIKSKNIFRALEALKADTAYQKVKLPTTSNMRGMGREQQIKQMEDYVFMVKGYTK